MEWTVAVGFIAGALLVYIVFSKDKEAIRGIYKQKGKYYYIKVKYLTVNHQCNMKL